jgi:hypothetical protein
MLRTEPASCLCPCGLCPRVSILTQHQHPACSGQMAAPLSLPVIKPPALRTPRLTPCRVCASVPVRCGHHGSVIARGLERSAVCVQKQGRINAASGPLFIAPIHPNVAPAAR